MCIAGSCLGDVYERLVGGFAGRIEGWVGEEGTGEVLKKVVWKVVLTVVVERVGLRGWG